MTAIVEEAVVAVAVVVELVEAVLSTGTAKPVKRMFIFPSQRDTFPIYVFSDSEKKIHQSWGGDDGNAEFKTEEAATFDAEAEATKNDLGTPEWGTATVADWGTATTATVEDWGGAAEPNVDGWGTSDPAPAEDAKPEQGRGRKDRDPEEEDNTLTLDQYLAQQKEKESAIPKLEGIRKANDGADDIFKNAVPLSKNEDEETYYVGKVFCYMSDSRVESDHNLTDQERP